MSFVHVQGKTAEKLAARLAKMDGPAAGKLAEDIAQSLTYANREERLAGKDYRGRQLRPLRGGRALTPAEIRKRGGNGPPLAPRRGQSRVITGFNCRVKHRADGAELVAGWYAVSDDGFPFLAAHAEGRGRRGAVPIRNVLAINPAMRAAMQKDIDKFEANLAKD